MGKERNPLTPLFGEVAKKGKFKWPEITGPEMEEFATEITYDLEKEPWRVRRFRNRIIKMKVTPDAVWVKKSRDKHTGDHPIEWVSLSTMKRIRKFILGQYHKPFSRNTLDIFAIWLGYNSYFDFKRKNS